MHNAGKVIYGNPLCCRLDLLRQFDGIYDEVGDQPCSVNLSGLLGIDKPVMQWTSIAENIRKEPDAYFQRHLHLGAFLTVPLPGNDHTLLPDPEIERYYLDYGPLLDALRGKRWLLLPHVIRVEGEKALANVFEVPGGYVIPVTFGGKESAARSRAARPAAAAGSKRLSRRSDSARRDSPGGRQRRRAGQCCADRRAVEARLRDVAVDGIRGWSPKLHISSMRRRFELGSTLEGARLHYTLDGSEPTARLAGLCGAG